MMRVAARYSRFNTTTAWRFERIPFAVVFAYFRSLLG